jgi:hypothetical protein
MKRRPENRIGGDFGLKYRRHRLRFSRQPAFDPRELRRVERRQLNHGHAHTTLIVQ